MCDVTRTRGTSDEERALALSQHQAPQGLPPCAFGCSTSALTRFAWDSQFKNPSPELNHSTGMSTGEAIELRKSSAGVHRQRRKAEAIPVQQDNCGSPASELRSGRHDGGLAGPRSNANFRR